MVYTTGLFVDSGDQMSKIGEQNVQRLFTEELNFRVSERFGKKYHHSYGEMNGKLDRTFADYFSSVGDVCILIEFKEFDAEIKNEKRKKLREKLCKELPENLKATSTLSHFVCWREERDDEFVLKLDRYVSRVCPLFGYEYGAFDTLNSDAFIEKYLSSELGAKYEPFEKYIDFLAGLPPGGNNNSFTGVILVFNKIAKIIKSIIFNSFSDFKKKNMALQSS